MKEKEFPISDDMAEYFDAYHAAINLRDRALKMPFGYRKAYRASKDAVKNNKKFWKKVFKVYPEAETKAMTYHRLRQVLTETIKVANACRCTEPREFYGNGITIMCKECDQQV